MGTYSKNQEDLISVIISVYNEELKWLKQSINSILNQTYKNLEIIVILDNPNNNIIEDYLDEVSKNDSRVKLIKNDINFGLVKSLNLGLRIASGKYIARLDADDIAIEDRIEYQKEFLEENILDFTYSGVTFIDEKGCELFETNKQPLTHYQIAILATINNISYHPTWFVKKEVYELLNGYREVKYCEDYDFTLRSIDAGYKLGKSPQNTIKYRVRQNGISKTYALEQYLNSEIISRAFQKKYINNLNIINNEIISNLNQITQYDKEMFIHADKLFNQGVELVKKNNYFIGFFKLLNAIMISKFFRNKFLKYLRYKVKVKQVS